MKKLILIVGTILIGISAQAQTCYTVRSIENRTENQDLASKKFTFGVKQMTEELLGNKKIICGDGSPVNVNILSIEAPSIGINIGPFMIKKKITVVKLEVLIDDNTYIGEGEAKLSVKAGFAELRDENLPFEKSVFASAVKKALEDSIQKIQ